MSLHDLTVFLGWSTVINFAVLIIAAIMIFGCRNFICNVHSKLTGVPKKDLPLQYFQYMANYKIAILVFNLAPYLALRIM